MVKTFFRTNNPARRFLYPLMLVLMLMLPGAAQDFSPTTPENADAVGWTGAPHISAFGVSLYRDNLQRQFLVKNGRLYRRVEPNWNHWQDITKIVNGVNQVGSGEITGFHTEFYQDTFQRQFLTRGGEVFRRTESSAGWSAWENISPIFAGVGQGMITSFSATLYADGFQRQFLVRGGEIFRRTQNPGGWSVWENISQVFAGVGSGVATSFGAEVYQDKMQRQFLVRGSRVYRRSEQDWNKWDDITNLFENVGAATDGRTDQPIFKRVMVLEFNPVIESRGNRRLNEVMNWRNPLVLEDQYIGFLEDASNHVVQYAVAQRQVIDQFPPRTDGTVYGDEQYISCFINKNCNPRETLDYQKVLRDYQVCEKLNRGEIDELWLWGGPYFGYFEANMAGPGAFNTNGTPVPNTACGKKLNIMGFNYEREPERMLEDMGHRIEGTMTYLMGGVWRNGYMKIPNPFPANANIFERFTIRGYDHATAACGNIHGGLNTPVYDPVNNPWTYDYNNRNYEPNTCDDWDNYPNLNPNNVRVNNCERWGCSDLGWHLYWLSKIPKYRGKGFENTVYNNWWKYVLDYDRAVHSSPWLDLLDGNY